MIPQLCADVPCTASHYLSALSISSCGLALPSGAQGDSLALFSGHNVVTQMVETLQHPVGIGKEGVWSCQQMARRHRKHTVEDRELTEVNPGRLRPTKACTVAHEERTLETASRARLVEPTPGATHVSSFADFVCYFFLLFLLDFWLFRLHSRGEEKETEGHVLILRDELPVAVEQTVIQVQGRVDLHPVPLITLAPAGRAQSVSVGLERPTHAVVREAAVPRRGCRRSGQGHEQRSASGWKLRREIDPWPAPSPPPRSGGSAAR